ncbi:MAG: lytic transglycosylase domain-containing protein, partial [Candidatus Eremiobacterota bacterium]
GGNFGPSVPNPGMQIPQYGPNPSKQQVGSMLDAAAQKYGVPPEILKAVAYKESRWNPNAVGDGGRSFGMMQIYTSAHPDYNVGRGQADPSYNIEYAAKMLSGLHSRYGNWQMAVTRYNGSGPMANAYAADVFNNILPNQPWRQWGA